MAGPPKEPASGPRKSKRGRRPKSEIERMRIDVWYQTVRNRLRFSDPRMDTYFDLFGSNVEPDLETGRKAPEERRRIFELVRTRQRDPTRIKLGDRVVNLVDLVNSAPICGMTKWTFEAPLWDLMLSPPNLDETQARLNALMDEFGMTFVPERRYWELLKYSKGMEPDHLYINCVRYTLGETLAIIGMSLVGLLYRQSYLAGQFTLTGELAKSFDALCSRFYYDLYLLDEDVKRKEAHIVKHFEYYDVTNRAVLGGSRDWEDPAPGTYDFAESPIALKEVLDDEALWREMMRQVTGSS